MVPILPGDARSPRVAVSHSRTSPRLPAVHAAALIALASVACDSESSEVDEPPQLESFAHGTVAAAGVHIVVTSDKSPIALAKIVLRETGEDGAPGAVVYQGFTDADGRLVASTRVLTATESVDVLLYKRGYSGPFSDEEWRTQYGYFAPAAWVRLPPAALAGMQVELVKEGG